MKLTVILFLIKNIRSEDYLRYNLYIIIILSLYIKINHQNINFFFQITKQNIKEKDSRAIIISKSKKKVLESRLNEAIKKKTG